jgi:hypothetical protein
VGEEARERAIDEVNDAGLSCARRCIARNDLCGNGVDVGGFGGRQERGRASLRILSGAVRFMRSPGDIGPADSNRCDAEDLGNGDEGRRVARARRGASDAHCAPTYAALQSTMQGDSPRRQPASGRGDYARSAAACHAT